MPDARPNCNAWSPRQHWTDAPGGPVPAFVIVCPACGAHAKIEDVPLRHDHDRRRRAARAGRAAAAEWLTALAAVPCAAR
jgi:hypothetical protein